MRAPRTLRLTARALSRADGLARLLKDRLAVRVTSELVSAYALSPSERAFARALLERHPRFWVYRCHQRCFAGDFLLVDMSAASERSAWALDLKMGAPLVWGGGGAGNAFVQLDAAVDELVQAGTLAPRPEVRRVTGDGAAVLEVL